ncbi:MAG: hydantoinase B/oxoprolinase family protein, partial [Acidobacteria bacterium]|nr:hydantoinase B/oxoprolinase family protein [Acidobacteriota bacterium]
ATANDVASEAVDAVRMGTTVATNALLEKRGSPTVLVTTRGLGDVLRIGYQNRPRIFAREIVLPEPLYREVIEAKERAGADGSVLQCLDQEALRRDLTGAFERGCRSAAIAFMHSWRFPDHEVEAVRIAMEVGFEQVSASHEVVPLMRIVSRGDTAVADAYVSPLLKRYVGRVRERLGRSTNLYFMQSNGGLTTAERFRGRDSLLSGPAGGVVGMAEVSKRAGFEKVIGFDMGGTSTDVALWAGEFERTRENHVGGVRMRVPMMSIHTVAAGGGSILTFRDGRLHVGPESAGADPGPASYRNGGPLTVTDANLFLGRLRPDHFPRVFGESGDMPVDRSVVETNFAELTDAICRLSDVSLSPEEVAEGFLRIAVERMATAIKEISIQRGHDVTGFTLCSFGGAGGQHACRVADAIGIETILLHPFAGVLSAYGMGVAELRAMRQRSVELPLTADSENDLRHWFKELGEQAAGELSRQGVNQERIRVLERMHVRYAGTDTSITIEWSDLETAVRTFNDRHQSQFGFLAPEREIVVESVEVEAIGQDQDSAKTSFQATGSASQEPISVERVFFDGEWRKCPVHRRADLGPGRSIEGPAIIIETNSTTVVEADWAAESWEDGNLVLRRVASSSRDSRIDLDVADPILLEVFNNLFMHIAEQMGAVLEHTSYSVNIKERLDFSCAVFDERGNLIANAPHIPIHLGSMGESVRTILRDNRGRMKPGDVYLLNAPYNGGTHLPDVTLITPLFDRDGETIEFVVASRGHHADIGGITPGSMPPESRSVHEEGILFDNFEVVSAGTFLEKELIGRLKSGPHPARNPAQNVADVKAQIGANQKGITELKRVIDHFGKDVVQAYMRHVRRNAEEAVSNVISGLEDGSFTSELDNGSQVTVSIRIDREKRRASIDFTGTSGQSQDNFNAPAAIARAAVLYVFRCLVDHDIPLNEGCLAPIDITIPDPSLLSPHYPAAVVAGNVETSQCITNALFGALGKLAAAQGTMNNFSFGNDEHQYYETICGGAGAGPGFDGASAVQTHMTNSRLTDPEVLEWRFPVRVEEFAIRSGSGGTGRWKGGEGVIRKIRFLDRMQAAILSGSRRVPPFGLEGGGAAEVGRNHVVRSDGSIEALGATARVDLEPGDTFVIETPGGGGFG